MMRPLDGLTVVGLGQIIAGPFGTRQLSELGAPETERLAAAGAI